MRTTRSVALLMALAIIGLIIVPVTGSVASTLAATDAEKTQSTATNTSVGTLMQASEADASNGIESELFETAYERADTERKATLVSDRTAELEEKVAALEAEREQLKANREQLSQGAYQSQLSRLTVQLAALERSIERTERRAEEVGVAEARLTTLRQNVTASRQHVSMQAGPSVAAVARGMADTGPADVATGPPSERGPDTEQSPANGPENRPSAADSTDQQSERPAETQPSESTSAAPSKSNAKDGESPDTSNASTATDTSKGGESADNSKGGESADTSNAGTADPEPAQGADADK